MRLFAFGKDSTNDVEMVAGPENPEERYSEEFMSTFRLPEVILNGMGMTIFHIKNDFWSRLKIEWLYYVSMGLWVQILVSEITYIILAFGTFDNFLEITGLAPCIGYVILGLCKACTIRLNENAVETLISSLGDMWPHDEMLDDFGRTLKKRYLNTLHKVMKFMTVSFFLLIWLFNLFPLGGMLYSYFTGEEVKRAFPYFMWYGYDTYYSPMYEITYFFQICAGLLTTIGIVSSDLLFTVSISHISMLFELLQHELINLIPDNLNIDNVPDPNSAIIADQLYDKLAIIIKKHQKINSYADILESIYSPVILINFCGSSIVICLVGFQATAIDRSELIKFVLFLMVSLVQVLTISYYGNLLQETSSGLAEAAYNSRWYQAHLKFKRALDFVILRAQKPKQVTALQFTAVSMKSFTSICRNSWSYFTLLRTMYNPNNKISSRNQGE